MAHRAGKHRNITFSAVTKIVGRLAARMKEDREVRKEVEIPEKELSTVKAEPSSGPEIPLFPVISPIKGRIDIFRHMFAGEIEQQEDQGPPEVYRGNS